MMFAQAAAADLSPHANQAIRSVRRAGPRMIVPPNTDATVLDALAERGLTRRFMGHIVLTAAGIAVLRVVTGT